jgi:dUTP pyrophosphatase
MKVRIKRLNHDQELPQYETDGSVGFDFQASETTTLQPSAVGLVPTGVVIETPPGYMLMLASRSSTPKKHGLSVPHGIGVIDQDYSGETDEIFVQFYNFTDQPVTIEKGTRVAQGVFVRVDIATWDEVEKMERTDRGGFGSTW